MGLTQADFDRIAAQQLRLFCLLAVFLYGGYTVTHYLFLPEAYVVEMMIISAVTTGVAGVVYVFREKPFVQNNAESCVMTILAMASFNVIAHLVFTEEMKHTTSFIVLLAVVAYMLPSLKNFITLVLSVVLTWVLLVSLMPGMKGDFFHFGFAMGLGVFMAVFLNHLRRDQLTPALVHNVMSHVPAAIVVRDSEGRTILANQAAMQLFGDDPSIRTGATLNDSELTFIIEGEDTDDGYSVDALDLTSGEKVADKLAGLNFPDGRTVWGFLSTFSVRTGMTEEKVEVLSFQQLPESGLPLVKPLS